MTAPWRKSAAVLFFAVVALLVNIDLQQHRSVQETFSGVSGHFEPTPHVDLARLLHKELPLSRLFSPSISGADDEDEGKQPSAWLAKITNPLTIFSFSASFLFIAFLFVYKTSPPSRQYLSRAPPHA